MGVLEDAIREHLELKRQHGASEEEVVQQETEALGRARREAQPAEAVPAEAELTDADELAAAGEPGAAEPVEEAAADAAALAEPPPAVEEEPVAEPLPEQPSRQPPPDSFVEEPEGAGFHETPAEAAPRERDETALLDDAVGFDEIEPGVAPPMPAREEEPPADVASGDLPAVTEDGDPVDEGTPKDEDVLEETPEFLQETPEHDRLWFEQKPPRDFDFD